MNERIKQIAEQAGLKVNADGEISAAFFGSVDAGYKKFAELIVRACADAADMGQDAGLAQVWLRFGSGLVQVRLLLLFGVLSRQPKSR